MRVLAGSVLSLLLVLLVPALPSSAHASLSGTDPADGTVLAAAPARVELSFDEPVTPVPTRWLAPDGRTGTLPTTARDSTVVVELPGDVPVGTQLLSWRVVSADGHPVAGVLTFSVGAPSTVDRTALDTDGTPWLAAASVGLRAALLAGLLLGLGLVVFDRLVLRGGPRPPGLLPVLRGAAGVSGAAAVVGLPLDRVVQQGTTAVTGSPLADPAVVETLLTLLAAAGVVVVSTRPWCRRTRTGHALTAVVLLLGVVAPAVTGHTRSVEPGWLVVAADLLHVAVAATWLGGLVGLLLVLRAGGSPGGGLTGEPPRHGTMDVPDGADPGRTVGPTEDPAGTAGHSSGAPDPASAASSPAGVRGTASGPVAVARPNLVDPTDVVDLADVVARFSTVAAVSAALLAASGTTMAVLVLGGVAPLVGTGYGRTLLLKLGLVAVVLGLAWWNRQRLVPAVRATGDASAARARLLRALLDEAGLLAVVVALTALLTSLSPSTPSPAPPPAPVQTQVALAGARAEVGLEPGGVGPGTLRVRLSDAGGEPLEPVRAPTVELTQPAAGVGPLTAELEPGADPGTWVGPVDLPVPGEWEVTLAVRVDDFSEPVGRATVTVR